MKTIGIVDWIAFTTQEITPLEKLLPGITSGLDFDYTGSGRYGYKHSYRAKNGAIIMTNGAPGMGTHCILSGAVMEAYREDGTNEKQVLQHIGKNYAKVSRLDIAIDVWDGLLLPENVIAAYRTGDAIMPIKSGHQAKEFTKDKRVAHMGHTAYFGSRTSERMLRVYHKGNEMGTNENWIRFELELKKLRAQSVTRKLQDDDLETRPVINAELAAFLQWKHKAWQEITRDKQGEIERFERKLNNTYKWLMETVVSALANYIIKHDDDDALNTFNAAVLAEIKRLRKIGR